MSDCVCCGVSGYDPIPIPPLRAGEVDGRYIDLSADLGTIGDSVPGLINISFGIARMDGIAMTSHDLQLAGSSWPNSLDPTGLIIDVGLFAPAASASIPYWVTLQVYKTYMGRIYLRDLTMTPAAAMG